MYTLKSFLKALVMALWDHLADVYYRSFYK